MKADVYFIHLRYAVVLWSLAFLSVNVQSNCTFVLQIYLRMDVHIYLKRSLNKTLLFDSWALLRWRWTFSVIYISRYLLKVFSTQRMYRNLNYISVAGWCLNTKFFLFAEFLNIFSYNSSSRLIYFNSHPSKRKLLIGQSSLYWLFMCKRTYTGVQDALDGSPYISKFRLRILE